jgi:ribosomal protein S27AE
MVPNLFQCGRCGRFRAGLPKISVREEVEKHKFCDDCAEDFAQFMKDV